MDLQLQGGFITIMIKLLTGNEPYALDTKIKGIKEGFSFFDMNFLESDTMGTHELNFLMQYPFMDNKKVLLLRLDTLGSCKEIEDYVENPNPLADLVICCKKIDKRTKLYKKLSKEGEVIECNKLDDIHLSKFIHQGIKKYNSSITSENLEFLIRRSCYEIAEDVTLYTICNYVKQLCFLSKNINKELIEEIIEERIEGNAFSLFTDISRKNSVQAYKRGRNLSVTGSDAISTLSALLRNYRVCLKARMAGPKAAQLIGLSSWQLNITKDAKRYSDMQLYNCINILQNAVNDIKVGKGHDAVMKTTITKLLQ